MAISNPMELLSLHSPPSSFALEADDKQHQFSKKRNLRIPHYQEAMAEHKKISSIHEIMNSEATERESQSPMLAHLPTPQSASTQRNALPAIDTALETLRGHQRTMSETLSSHYRSTSESTGQPALPSFSELYRGAQEFQDAVTTGTVRRKPTASVESLLDGAPGSATTSPIRDPLARRARPTHHRMASEPQLFGFKRTATSEVDYSRQAEQPQPPPPPPLSQSLASSGHPARSYHHSRNDSMQPSVNPFASGPPASNSSYQPYPSPPIATAGGTFSPAPNPSYYHYNHPPSHHGYTPVGSHSSSIGPPAFGQPVPSMNMSSTPNSTAGALYKKRRGNLPREGVRVMRKWLEDNKENPYPDEQQKQWFVKETNLSIAQINNWFINARRRLFSPQERERVRKNRAEASGSQSSGSRPNSSHSNKSVPDFSSFESRLMKKNAGK